MMADCAGGQVQLFGGVSEVLVAGCDFERRQRWQALLEGRLAEEQPISRPAGPSSARSISSVPEPDARFR